MSWNLILCLWLLHIWFIFVLSLTQKYSKKHQGIRGGSRAISFRRQWVKPRLQVSVNVLAGVWLTSCSYPPLPLCVSACEQYHSHDNHEKIYSWVSFSFLYEHGALLGDRLGRQSSAITHNPISYLNFQQINWSRNNFKILRTVSENTVEDPV